MKQQIRSFPVAAYLVLCIIFGGSAQIPWPNLGLQIVGIALITWAAISGAGEQNGQRSATLKALLIGGLVLVLIQLVPLPPSIWTKLPGRLEIVEGLGVLGYPLRPFSISEMPYNSLVTLFAAIPAFAAFVVTERLAPSSRAVAVAIVLGLVAAIFLGALQVAGGPASWAYFYEIHSPGAIGFFANGNHMATLLLIGIPMAAALVVSAKSNRRTSAVASYGLGVGFFALVILGIVLNGSRAGIALSFPVIVASASLFPTAARWRGATLGASIVAFIIGVSVIMSNPINSAELDPGATSTAGSRGEIWSVTAQAIADSFPVGTGLGTFQDVYHRYEKPDQVTRAFVNHAHNDYLELILELGAGGLLITIVFLIWWTFMAARIWISTYSTVYVRAATISTGAILVHSFVDFPLRTAGISAIFGACIGIMARHLSPTFAAQPGDLRPRRHVRLG